MFAQELFKLCSLRRPKVAAIEVIMADSLISMSYQDQQVAQALVSAKATHSFQFSSSIGYSTDTELGTTEIGKFQTAVIYFENFYPATNGYSRANIGLFIIPNMNKTGFASITSANTSSMIYQNRAKVKSDTTSITFYMSQVSSTSASTVSIGGIIAVLS